MKKYQCNACGIHFCTAEYQGGRDVPCKCTGISDVYYKPQWKEDTELPKLTAEVFDRPDCPEWAQYAAVDINGIACFFDKKPKCDNIQMWLRGKNGEHFTVIKRNKYDTSAWQNSLIKRPATLPDWCKVGEWVWVKSAGSYEQITEISGTKIATKHLFWSIEAIGKTVFQTRLRPYNAEGIPDLPFEVTEKKSSFRTTVVSCQGNNVWLAGATTAISAERLMRDFTAKWGPCGVLEHLEEGEWVK